MTRDQKILYACSISLPILLLLALLIPSGNSRILAACFLIPAAVLIWFGIPKRSILSINKRYVLLILTVIAVLWVVLLYVAGLRFGISKNPRLTFRIFTQTVLPIFFGIIAIEIIRSVLSAQKNKAVDVLTYLSCVLAEVLICADLSAVNSFHRLMDVIGLVLVPAISGNILYMYVSRRYGFVPVVVYRLIITLYSHVLHVKPNIPGVLLAFGSALLPSIVHGFVSVLYERKPVTHRKTKKGTYVALASLLLVMLSTVMIISGQFRYGTVVIASKSMTGTLNKGDAIVYERYEDQSIEKEQIIMFQKNGTRYIHRVIDIEQIDGVTRYYTKGDANESPDVGYITDKNILGIVDLRLAYMGYPTLWLREAFSRRF